MNTSSKPANENELLESITVSEVMVRARGILQKVGFKASNIFAWEYLTSQKDPKTNMPYARAEVLMAECLKP